MKLEFISMDQKPNSRACNGSTHDLLSKVSCHIPLLKSSCWQCSGAPKSLTLNILRRQVSSVNYSDMLRNELRSDIPSNQRGRLSQGVVVVTRQCTPSYGTNHHQHHSKNKLGSYWAPSQQPRLGPFHFPFIWTPKRSLIFQMMTRWNKRNMSDFIMNQKAVFPMALKCVQINGQSVSRRKDIILQNNTLLTSVIQIKTFKHFFWSTHILSPSLLLLTYAIYHTSWYCVNKYPYHGTMTSCKTGTAHTPFSN
jgi:hypothetical protein